MVAPSPDLQRRIRNTESLLRQNKAHLVDSLHRDNPQDYLSLDEYNSLMKHKPWKEGTNPKAREKNLQHLKGKFQNTSSVKTLQTPSQRDRILVICVDFSDKVASTPIYEIQDRFFSSNPGALSMRNYYTEVSYGRFVPEGVVLPRWYRAPQPLSYYAGDGHCFGFGAYPNDMMKLYEELLDMAMSDISPYLSYLDINNNKNIQFVCIVHAGDGAEVSGSCGSIWSHMSGISDRYYGNYYFNTYMTVPEKYFSNTSYSTHGVTCHEFGHLLGLSDLYSYCSRGYGIGNYSVMAHGSWLNYGNTPCHPDGSSKLVLGFTPLTDTNLDVAGTLTVQNAENNDNNYVYLTDYSVLEYFLIENRQRIGYDAYIPADGILIWHASYIQGTDCAGTCTGYVDPITGNTTCCLYDNLDVVLLQADGQDHLMRGINKGDPGDSYPGIYNVRSFGKNTYPDTLYCNGTKKLDLEITNISNSGNIMSFNAVLCKKPQVTLTIGG